MKKGTDLDDARRKREEKTIQIRKVKNAVQIAKHRKVSHPSINTTRAHELVAPETLSN